ncbi:hypothetical protein V1515DRAFT_618186 [Lipomyces mesembrius]
MANRSIGRNVDLYDASKPDDALGGLILRPSITKNNFLFMLEILIIASHPYGVSLRDTGVNLTASDEPLEPGHYDIRPNSPEGTISVADELCTVSGRDEGFRSLVRARDGKCMITGRRNVEADRGLWRGFQAAHIFPLSSEQLFIDSGSGRLITNRAGERDNGINSCQNGLLICLMALTSLSTRTDDHYKITCFGRDDWLDGRILDPIFRDPNKRESVRDELLRWHFRQAVLANMKITA